MAVLNTVSWLFSIDSLVTGAEHAGSRREDFGVPGQKLPCMVLPLVDGSGGMAGRRWGDS